VLDDLRLAFRVLRKSPGFTALAVLTLALGIGANTTIFSVVNGVLLRPLPYASPERLVDAYEVRDGSRGTVSPPDYADWRDQSDVFDGLAALNPGSSFALSGGDGPAQQVAGASVTPRFFGVLGVAPALGRDFLPAEGLEGQTHVALLGHGLWQRRFGADPAVVGRSIRLDGESYQVVGVMPQGSEYPRDAELWVPLAFTKHDLTTQRGAHYLEVIGRLRPGATLAGAQGEMDTLSARLAEAYPDTNRGMGAELVPLQRSIVGSVSAALEILLGAVALVLLIACTNVASLGLARARRRERELAVRVALGAGRWQLVRGVLAESLLVAFAGGAVGLAVAAWTLPLLRALQPGDIPRFDEVRIDGVVLAFAVAVSLLSALLSGLVPAWQIASRPELQGSLRSDGRGLTPHQRARRFRTGLVVAEMTLAVTLLAGAALLARSFVSLVKVDPGFEPAHTLTFSLSLPDARYSKPEQADAFYADLMGRLRALPGVSAAGAVFGLPLSGFRFGMSAYELDGRRLPSGEDDRLSTQVRIATPGYFRALGLGVLSGRVFSDADRAGAPPVVVVNEAAARLLWPGQDPIGHHLTIGSTMGLGRGHLGGEVIGVVRNAKDFGLEAKARPETFVCHRQFPVGFMSVVLRAAGDPEALAHAAIGQVAALDPEVPAFDVRSMDQRVAESVAQPRFYMLLLGLFSAVALALAAVGIYGVMSYAVGERRREIGVRMALGAMPREVLALVVRQGMATAAVGAALGLAGAVVGARLLRTLLYGIGPTDVPALTAAVTTLTAVALLACYLPARRAARVDPIEALRHE
jgi:putative ABC transport system permease protein